MINIAISSIKRIHIVLLITVIVMCFMLQVQSDVKYFNVKKYGAVGDGKSDCTKAFLSGWNDACKWRGKSQLVVPHGTYIVRQILFAGPCLGSVDFNNAGILQARGDNSAANWIAFEYIDKLTILGGGTFDGQGQKSLMRISEDVNFERHPISLLLGFVNNSRIQGVRFINSKDTHIKLFRCNNIMISHVTIIAPSNSPNTDGMNISHSTKIQVSDSKIATGDDCISILSGAEDVNITGILCGPGHGISVGSIGAMPNEADVKGVIVRNCNFTNTLNGVRIKTWATKNVGNIAYISFERILVDKVYNPIIIDQDYCPSGHCPKGDSHVQISNVKFIDIRGVSKSRVAVNFQCSKYRPCQIETRNIDLKYDGRDGPIKSSCTNVHGIAQGYQKPPSCISKPLEYI